MSEDDNVISETKEARPLSFDEMQQAFEGLVQAGKVVGNAELNNPVQMDYLHVVKTIVQVINSTPEGDTPYVIFPVDEPVGTKKNKVTLDPSDKESPTGLIQKTDEYAKFLYAPNAAARFDANEVLAWIVVRMAEDENLGDEELEKLAEALRG